MVLIAFADPLKHKVFFTNLVEMQVVSRYAVPWVMLKAVIDTEPN